MKRQRYPKSLKEQLVREVQEVGNAVPVAKRHGINLKTLYRPVHEAKHKAWEVAAGVAKKIAPYVPSPQEFRQRIRKMTSLKRYLVKQD
ncbi:MAG: transposase [Dehalococcoidia bacterium]